MNKNILVIGLISLFVLSTFTPMVVGFNTTATSEVTVDDIDRHLLPEYYDSYSIEEIPEHVRPYVFNEAVGEDKLYTYEPEELQPSLKPLDGLMDSVWPMYKHNPQNTGRCDYDTSNNVGGELWKYYFKLPSAHSTVIDKDGILYVPTWYALHSVYPDGTNRWIIDHGDLFTYTPALGEDGTIYFGTTKQFFACYPNGTIKWTLDKVKDFSGCPTIGTDGTIYAGTDDGYLYAINPNGTIRWEYYIGEYNYIIDPAVDNQGNIYFTTYYSTGALYCLNPNGTLKWKYAKNRSFDYGPVIGDDGTIYAALIHFLIAVNPNGTEKWEVHMHDWVGNPSLAHDGTIIIAGEGNGYVTAVNPADGSIIWQYQVSNSANGIKSSDVAIGGDGTLYFAYTHHETIGYMCALTSDGVLKWETHLTSDKPYTSCDIISEPCISSDGTVYIYTNYGGIEGGRYLHAIGMQNPIDAPEAPVIEGETNGRAGSNYEYTLQATSPTGDDVYFFVDWDDQYFEEWFGPYPSGTQVTISHSWKLKGTYTIRVRAKTGDGLCSPWSEFSVNMKARNRVTQRPFFNFLEQHSILYQLLQRFLQL